jgi:hypothetical protein
MAAKTGACPDFLDRRKQVWKRRPMRVIQPLSTLPTLSTLFSAKWRSQDELELRAMDETKETGARVARN